MILSDLGLTPATYLNSFYPKLTHFNLVYFLDGYKMKLDLCLHANEHTHVSLLHIHK